MRRILLSTLLISATIMPRAKNTPALGRLTARTSLFSPSHSSQFPPKGLEQLDISPVNPSLFYVPPSYSPDRPSACILTLHGSGGNPQGGLSHLLPLADQYNTILISPGSRRSTWDIIQSTGGELGPDIAHIDAVLTEVFTAYNIDPSKLAISGFSDGASYALTVGLANGDLFSHIIAYSPGFMRPPATIGSPRIYLSHGTVDQVLPVRCSRSIIQRLKAAGYQNVRYDEFNGPHIVPSEIARAGVEFLTKEATSEP